MLYLNHRWFYHRAALLAACVALAACVTAPSRQQPLPAGTFASALQDDYLRLAAQEHDDRLAANHFMRKAKDVAAGKTVRPDSPRVRGLDAAGRRRAFADGRRLASVLTPDSKRLFPAELARAQTSYDCLLSQLRRKENADLSCAANFGAAMGPLEQHRLAVTDRTGLTLLPAVPAYMVSFTGDDMDKEAAGILDDIALTAGKVLPVQVAVTASIGHARTHAARHLAAAHAVAVAQALKIRGVSAPIVTAVSPGGDNGQVAICPR